MLQIGVCSNDHIAYPFGTVMDREVGQILFILTFINYPVAD